MRIDVGKLAKLQVFIDCVFGVHLPSPPPGGGLVCVNPEIPFDTAGDSVEGRFLRMAIEGTPQYRSLADVLRRTEAYAMVSFLLKEGGGETVADLSARYGVSSSQFRRLFRSELGVSPKAELRGWRMARAVLDVIENSRSVTRAAMDNGYASPSHFAGDVKNFFGISLTQLIGGSAVIGKHERAEVRTE